MELYAKGQLSFLILNCLLERDFYGLDIISEISDRSNGNIQLKKPSVYSNLTRMEKQKYVSSYLKSSDLGPNRKYYSITEKGRGFYNELKAYFERNNIDVFRDFNEYENSFVNNNEKDEQDSPSLYNSNIENFLNNKNNESDDSSDSDDNHEDEDFFDFSSLDKNSNSDEKNNDESTAIVNTKNDASDLNVQSDNKDNIQHKLFDEKRDQELDEQEMNKNDHVFESKENNTEHVKENNTSSFLKELQKINNDENRDELIEEQRQEEKKDDAVFLSNSDANEYNKRLYDISKEINRYKRKRSFAEDQISMTVNSPLSESTERTKASIEDFKNSMLENKGKYVNDRLSADEFYNKNSLNYKQKIASLNDKLESKSENNEKSNIKDDAVFITQRINSDNIERAKKIEPPRLKIITDSSRDNRLPAPKRDTSIDPSHKEILSRLYSRTKDSKTEEVREDSLYDYNDLKDFYKNQNISFNVYKKPAEKTEHNTNKLYLIISSVVFILASLFSTILYLIFLKSELLNNNTNFLFILLPGLLIIDVIVKFYNYKKYRGWLPSQMMPQWKIWIYALLFAGCIIGLNFICGLNTTNFNLFATTLILPLVILFAMLPVRYYLKRIILVKYWK